MSQPTFSVVTLTPEMAADLLSRNEHNRKFSKANYGTVRRSVENGEWMLNGESIKISQNGYILDGQHRCRAVVETGISIPTLLVEGLPDESQDTMDTGKTRTLADILTIRGDVNTIGLSALIRKFLVSERYGFVAAFSSSMGSASYSLTNRECLEWLDGNPWVRDYVQPGRTVSRATSAGSSMAGFLMRTFDNIDAEDSAFFWGRVLDGVNLAEGHPIYTLRKTLRLLSENGKGERNQKYLGALIIKAWNAYRSGDEVLLLRFRVGGAKPETFPVPA